MVKNPLNIVEGNVEICSTKMTKNPLKNFHHIRKNFWNLLSANVKI